MNVLLLNGSPHVNGCTFTALSEVADTLEKNDISTQIFQLGMNPVRGCIACGACRERGCCTFDDDLCNEVIVRLKAADGFVVGSPVYYAGINGALAAILDRVFFSMPKADVAFKPAAAVVSCRRGGSGSAFDRLNKYFTISRMPVVSSQYWNNVHGVTAPDVRKDLEGLQTMRTLGANMAWLLKSIAAGAMPPPAIEPATPTNFIR